MNEWIAIIFFIGLLLVISDHNSKEKYSHQYRQRSKSI